MKLSRLAQLCQVLMFVIIVIGGFIWGISAYNEHRKQDRQQELDDAYDNFYRSIGME